MDYVTPTSEDEMEDLIEDLVRHSELRFHTRNKRNKMEVKERHGRCRFIRGLLTRPIQDRIGCGKDAMKTQIMPHEYFKGIIQWDLVDKKQLLMPYKPAVPFY